MNYLLTIVILFVKLDDFISFVAYFMRYNYNIQCMYTCILYTYIFIYINIYLGILNDRYIISVFLGGNYFL